MAEPLPDPRVDVICEVESSEEEEEDLFGSIKTSVNGVNSGQKETKTIKTTPLNKNSKKSKKRSTKKDLVCNQCKPVRHFKKQKVLDLHKEFLHKVGPQMVCLWCAKQFFTQNQLLVHQTLYFHDKPTD